ncbi:MAG: Oligoendopeptidase F, plasmid [Chlamydiae bacterium]|nr:Oligoendopeptidase F, plasmid [Chlamydiota bacterium]
MIKTRSEIGSENAWNVEALFSDLQTWNREFVSVFESETAPHWPTIHALVGRLVESDLILKTALEEMMNVHRKLAALYTYAHLRHDEDLAHNDHKASFARITTALHQFQQETSWFEPELLALPDEKIEQYLNSPQLKEYRHYLESIIRLKPHTLSKKEEAILAQVDQSLMLPYKTFCAINDTDFKFGNVQDSHGQSHPLTHGQYMVYLKHTDRTLRQNTFETYHAKFKEYQNTLAEVLVGQVQNDVFKSRCRQYSSTLEASLKRNNIPTSVYQTLIDTVNGRLSSLHRYLGLKKKVLGLDSLHLYDLSAPITPDVDIRMSFDEAVQHIVDSTSVLGSEYQETLAKGLNEQRWVDRYENENKRSGAYSSGCYDSMPYILMNYKGLLRDVFTLAHEAGHSMHSTYSKQFQPYHYGDYSIFVAEVASTFNEELLMQHLLKTRTDKKEQIFLIHQKLEDIRGTLFRQTMFAEYELKLHSLTENYVPLTPDLLTDEFKALNEKYFGPDVVIDPPGMVEWARIPHFYYNFYVYQYATGISAALALCNRVMQGGEQKREDYLNFLKSGSCTYPIDVLNIAGVDMTSSQPVSSAIDTFDKLLDQLEKLI